MSIRSAGTPSVVALVAGSLLAVAALLVADRAVAEVQRIEAVGAVGIRSGDRSAPRRAAVQAGLREAVLRVANELLMDSELVLADPGEGDLGDGDPAAGLDPAPDGALDDPLGGGGADEGPSVQTILGDDMVRYTARFRVVEDRGLGPVLFVKEPGIEEEYVVVVAVEVEVDRVREALVRAGLLLEGDAASTGRTVRLEVQGLRVYPALAELRDLLVGTVGAESAIPVHFERHRAVVAVRTTLSASALIERLAREAPPHMEIVALAAGSDREGRDAARIAVRWTPPPAPAADSLPAVDSRGRHGPKRHSQR